MRTTSRQVDIRRTDPVHTGENTSVIRAPNEDVIQLLHKLRETSVHMYIHRLIHLRTDRTIIDYNRL